MKYFNKRIIVFDDSMKPLILKGDHISYKKVSFKSIKTNDIIVVKQKSKLIIHRVIYKTNHYLRTKGDNNAKHDGKLYPDHILGKVQTIQRDGAVFKPDDIYTFQSTVYWNEIKSLSNCFEKNKINYVFLKGLPLHLQFIKKFPRRIYADCDVLISEVQKDLVHKLLISLGFIPRNMENKEAQMFLNKSYKEVEYIKHSKNSLVVFDIHYQIAIAGHIVSLPNDLLRKEEMEITNDFLDTKMITELDGVTIPSLDPSKQIFYLLLHFSKHKWSEVHYLELIATLVKKLHFSWYDVLKLAQNYNVIYFILPSILLLNKYFGIPDGEKQAKDLYIKEYNFAMRLYQMFYSESSIFNEENMYLSRLKKAIITFVFINETNIKKVIAFLHPSFTVHFIYIGIYSGLHIFQGSKKRFSNWRDRI